MHFEQKQILTGVAIIIAVIAVIGYYFYKNVYKTEEISIETPQNEIEETIKPKEDIEEQIIVHIAGEVNTPGIIKTMDGARIADIIEKAGGLKEEADITDINLAYPVEDGQKIVIPKIGEQKEEYVTKESGIQEEESGGKTNQTGVININKATKEELQTLQGIRRIHSRKNYQL